MRSGPEGGLRIGFAADDLYPGFGGQAIATHGHVAALAQRGHEIRVLAGREDRPTTPPTGVKVERLPVWKPGNKMTHYAWPDRERIARLLEWAEVVQVNTPTPFTMTLLRMARERGIPTVAGFHAQEENVTLHFPRGRTLVVRTLRAWYRRFFRLPDLIVAPTAFAARLVARYTDRRTVVVSNGLRLPQRDAALEGRALAMRRRLLGEGQRWLLCYVGRLSHEKRPQDLLDIAAALGPEVKVAIAGTGPLAPTMEARSSALDLGGRVEYLGFVPDGDKEALLEAADLFLMPSPTELQSIATLEAIAHGCVPAVADYETSAVGEWVAAGECGILYDPQSPEGAARAIREHLGDPARLAELQRNALRLARRHDLGESASRLEQLYRELIAERRPA